MQITYEESFSKYLRKDGEITISDFNRYRISYMENKKRVRLNFKTQEEAINKILTMDNGLQKIEVKIKNTDKVGVIVAYLPLFPKCNYNVLFDTYQNGYKTKFYKTEEFEIINQTTK